MKNRNICTLFILFLSFTLTAQDGKEKFKAAKKDFNIYKLDQSNKSKLSDAVEAIDMAIKAPDMANSAALWLLGGDIYNEIASQIVVIRQTGLGDPGELPQKKNPAKVAFSAYEKALQLSTKKYETNDALRGLRAVESYLYNTGVFAYEDGDYTMAYTNFHTIELAHKLLKDAGGESSLDDQEAYLENAYISGLAALNAGFIKEAKVNFEALVEKNYNKPDVYEALYKIETSDPNADLNLAYTKYLEPGREKYPEDVSLLFAEINHFLRTNQLNKLILKLESAIEKEPDNVSLYSTLGNVYDNLYQSEARAGNQEKANDYFTKSLHYYNQAIAKDPAYTDAIYSIGALYFNKAAMATRELQSMGDDISEAGMKKYEAKRDEILTTMDQALPYFQKVESLDPNDINSLIALKEIYAKKDDIKMFNEFKKRLETVQNGGSNTAYFTN